MATNTDRPIILKGRNANIELYANRLVINRRFGKLIRTYATGEAEIFLDSIKSINFKKANTMTFGFLQVETHQNSDKLKKGTLFFTPTDDFTINFTKNDNDIFFRLKNEIDKRRNKPKEILAINNSGGVDDIEKLFNLKEKGIITSQEFEAKKKQFLNI